MSDLLLLPGSTVIDHHRHSFILRAENEIGGCGIWILKASLNAILLSGLTRREESAQSQKILIIFAL